MSKFDFNRHQVVAVVAKEGDPERGQHYHVDLGEFLEEARQYVAQLPAPEQPVSLPAVLEPREVVKETVVREELPAEVANQIANMADRLEFLAKTVNALDGRMTELGARVQDVESRPHLSEQTVRELMDGLNTRFKSLVEKLVNGAMGDVRSRLVSIERNGGGAGIDPDSEKLSRLAETISALSKYVREIETTVEDRHADLERKYAEIAEHLTDVNVKTMKVSTRLYRALKALEVDPEERGAA